MTGKKMAGMAVAAVLVAGACKGTPDGAFNGGAPVALPALTYYEQGQVLRGADGSTYAVAFGDEVTVTKLAPDGSVDGSWGTGGTTVLPFVPLGTPHEGAVGADGSLVLFGWISQYDFASVRVTPGGDLDGAYGGDGTADLIDLYVGTPDFGACTALTDGTVRCIGLGDGLATDELVLRSLDAAGQPASEASVPVDLEQFARPVPPEATWSNFGVGVADLAVTADGVLAAFTVRTVASSDVDFWPGEADIVLVKLTGAGVDASWGDGGYALFDLEATGGGIAQGAGDDDASVADIAHSPVHGTTVAAVVADSDTFEHHAAGLRLAAGGGLLATAAGGGLWPITLPDATPVTLDTARARPHGQLTVGGSVPDGGGERGVVLRYLPDGSLDPTYAGDGVFDVAGSSTVHALDDRNGRTTIGAAGSTIGGGGEIDLLISVLWG